MKDETFKLPHRMYNEFTTRFNRVGVDVGSLKNDVNKIQVIEDG